MDELTLISKLMTESSENWRGSVTFLARYVKQALKKIKDGPRIMTDPSVEFME